MCSGFVDRCLLTARSLAKSVARFVSSPHDRPELWTPAHASKAARANQLPVCLSATKTATFGSALRCSVRGRFGLGSEAWQGQFQGQFEPKGCSRNPNPVVYLGFSRGEVAERLKAAVC